MKIMFKYKVQKADNSEQKNSKKLDKKVTKIKKKETINAKNNTIKNTKRRLSFKKLKSLFKKKSKNNNSNTGSVFYTEISRNNDIPKSKTPELPESQPPELPKSQPPELPKSQPPELPKSQPPELPKSQLPKKKYNKPDKEPIYDIPRPTIPHKNKDQNTSNNDLKNNVEYQEEVIYHTLKPSLRKNTEFKFNPKNNRLNHTPKFKKPIVPIKPAGLKNKHLIPNPNKKLDKEPEPIYDIPRPEIPIKNEDNVEHQEEVIYHTLRPKKTEFKFNPKNNRLNHAPKFKKPIVPIKPAGLKNKPLIPNPNKKPDKEPIYDIPRPEIPLKNKDQNTSNNNLKNNVEHQEEVIYDTLGPKKTEFKFNPKNNRLNHAPKFKKPIVPIKPAGLKNKHLIPNPNKKLDKEPIYDIPKPEIPLKNKDKKDLKDNVEFDL